MSSKKSNYQDYALQILRSETPYYQLKESICQFMDGNMNDAGVFAYIKNRLRRLIHSNNIKAKRTLTDNGFWFMCPAQDIERDLCIKRDKRIATLKKLTQVGLIETKVRGAPATLWVKINIDRELEIDDWYNEKKAGFFTQEDIPRKTRKLTKTDVGKSENCDVGKSENSYIYSNINNKDKKERKTRASARSRASSSQRNNGKPQFFDEFKPPKRKIKSSQIAQADKPYYAMYKQLRHALRVNKRSVSTEETANSAISHFKKLCRDVGQERVQNVLDWYSANCTIEKQDIHGLPGVSCAKHFCRHFEWIDKARRDATGASSKKSPKMKQTTDGWVEA